MFPRTACKYSPMAAEKIAEMQKAQKIFVMSLAEELLGRNNVGVSLYLDYIVEPALSPMSILPLDRFGCQK